MMITRCVHIFPRFKFDDFINNFRIKYDYLHECIEPHITLVYPFISNLSNSCLVNDISYSIKNIEYFDIVCSGFSKVYGKEHCIVMNISKGYDSIYKMHYLLHQGLLRPFQSPQTIDGSYMPHITIGRFNNKNEIDLAFKEIMNINYHYKANIKNIFVENIGKNNESIIESEIELKKRHPTKAST